MLTRTILRTKRRLIAAFGIFIFLISIWGALFYTGILQINRPTRPQFPIQGIDISEHQGEIDWAKIDRREVNFVFIKATEGGDYRDLRFDRNWLGSKNVKIDRGADHFFTFCKAGSLQAQNFSDTVPVSQDILPPVIISIWPNAHGCFGNIANVGG